MLVEYPSTPLEGSRGKAGECRKLIKRGVDPAELERRQRQAEEEERLRQAEAADERLQRTFEKIAEAFVREKARTEVAGCAAPGTKGCEIAQDFRREFIPRWGKLPIDESTDRDVAEFVEIKKQTVSSRVTAGRRVGAELPWSAGSLARELPGIAHDRQWPSSWMVRGDEAGFGAALGRPRL